VHHLRHRRSTSRPRSVWRRDGEPCSRRTKTSESAVRRRRDHVVAGCAVFAPAVGLHGPSDERRGRDAFGSVAKAIERATSTMGDVVLGTLRRPRRGICRGETRRGNCAEPLRHHQISPGVARILKSLCLTRPRASAGRPGSYHQVAGLSSITCSRDSFVTSPFSQQSLFAHSDVLWWPCLSRGPDIILFDPRGRVPSYCVAAIHHDVLGVTRFGVCA